MKILIATGIYPPDIGGPATYSKLLFNELPKRGIEVGILSFGEVRRLPKIVRHFAYLLKLLKRARGADAIFAQDPVSVGFPAAIAAKILRKKFILKVVGDYAWEQHMQSKTLHKFSIFNFQFSKKPEFISPDEFQEKKFDWLTELRRKIEGRVAKMADRIITPSEYLKKIVSTWLSHSQVDKIAVVYNAFDAPELNAPKEEARTKITEDRRPGAGDFLIISAGRLVPWKGFAALIEIMPEILKEIPNAKLLIIGDGPERSNLKSQISNLKIDESVLLLGRLSHKDALLHLRAGDLFVLNTGYEGFSHFILEAMATEIPVVTTDVGGNPEAITNGKDGILVEYGDKEELKEAVVRLAKNEETRRELAAAAKEKIKQFNKERMLRELVEVLKS